AQTTGHVAGTVRDVQGAVIAHAEVSAQNADTGERRTVTTDESGSYTVAFLQAGTYQFTFSAPGFAAARFTNVQTVSGETANINAVLRVAGTTNEVTVEDAPPLVQSNSAEIGLSIDTPKLTSTPLPT